MKNLQKMLLALLIAGLVVVSVFSAVAVKAEEDTISDYDNVKAEQVINDINNTVSSGDVEGEVKYDQNYTTYRLTVYPQSVMIGNSVTATAETNNRRATNVTFVWVKMFKIKKIETVPVYSNDSWKIANSTYFPDELGQWFVFALFKCVTSGGCSCKCSCGWLFAMRWACFKVREIPQQIPDFPVVGTAGAMTTMLLGLGLFLNRKKQKPI